MLLSSLLSKSQGIRFLCNMKYYSRSYFYTKALFIIFLKISWVLILVFVFKRSIKINSKLVQGIFIINFNAFFKD